MHLGATRISIIATLLTLAASACSEDDAHYVASLPDDGSKPTMTTTDVSTYVSDSGYVKYHAVTPIWEMYDDTSDPYWRFPDGLDLSTFDRGMKPNADVTCDSAVYFTARRLFRLDGNVVAINVERDTFLTQQLFWDQAKTRFYTDSFIHIVKSDRVIEGYGFTSNERMTDYIVHRPTAIIPASSLRDRENKEPGVRVVNDDEDATQPVSNVTGKFVPRPSSQKPAPEVRKGEEIQINGGRKPDAKRRHAAQERPTVLLR